MTSTPDMTYHDVGKLPLNLKSFHLSSHSQKMLVIITLLRRLTL
jgi:hypothetical protein